MKLKIIDASVAIKWFVKEEKGKKEADALLSEIEANPKPFAVPEIFFNEMLSVLCRIVKSESQVKIYVEDLENLGLERIGNGREILAEAIRLAFEFNLTGYDAIYAATATLTEGVWITADLKAHQKIKKRSLSELANVVCEGLSFVAEPAFFASVVMLESFILNYSSFGKCNLESIILF